MDNIIIIAILVFVLGLAALYIYRAKKKGQKCIGCPYSADGKCGGSCDCGNDK